MDPANAAFIPNYYVAKLGANITYRKLSKNDANFVDIIHSNSGAFPQAASLWDPLGHQDFYPNGGYDQPGCSNTFWDYISTEFRAHIPGIDGA